MTGTLVCVTESADTQTYLTHTHTHNCTPHCYINSLLNREPQLLHEDLYIRYSLFVHLGIIITIQVPHLSKIKVALNVTTACPSSSLIKPWLKSCSFCSPAVQLCKSRQMCRLQSWLPVFSNLSPVHSSHRDDNVEIESVVGLTEAQDEKQAEQTGSWQAPVEPGKLCNAEHNPNLRVTKHVLCLKWAKLKPVVSLQQIAVLWTKSC